MQAFDSLWGNRCWTAFVNISSRLRGFNATPLAGSDKVLLHHPDQSKNGQHHFSHDVCAIHDDGGIIDLEDNRVQLEGLIHRVFASAALDLTIHDRFDNPVKPREWFLVPLNIIDEVVTRIRDGSIVNYIYDPAKVALVTP